MKPIEPLIWDVCEAHPNWLREAEENGVDKHLYTMEEFIRQKLNEEVI